MRNAYIWVCLALWALTGWSIATAQAQRVAEVFVDLGVTHQTMEGFGGCFQGWMEPESLRDPAWYDALVNDLGVSMVRIPVPPNMEPVNDDDDPNHFNWSAFKLGLSEPMPTERTAGPQNPMPSQLDRCMKTALEFKKRGVDRFMASLWSPPGFMKTNREIVQGGHLRMDMVDEFAEYMAAFVILAKKNYGIDIGALSLQNELYFIEYYDSCVYSPAHLREAVRAVGRKFRKEGIRTRILMPEEMMTVHRMIPYVTPTMADPETRGYVGAFCTHRQGGFDEVRRWHDATRQYGLQTWMTETSGHPRNWRGAVRMAGDMRDYIVGGDVSAWLYWMLTDVGAMRGGRPSPKFHAARHFYRFVRPGAVRVQSASNDPDLLDAAFRHDADGTVSVVLINRGDTALDVAVKVTGASAPAAYRLIQSTEAAGSAELGRQPAARLHVAMPARSILTLYGQSNGLNTTAAATPWPNAVDVPATREKWGNFDMSVMGEGYATTRSAEMNMLEALRRDIAAGKANATRTNGWTALHWACLCGSSQAIALLLDNGADVNRPANDGWTPLHAAAGVSFTTDNNNKRLVPDASGAEIVEMLLAAGADVRAATRDGWTPLMSAVAAGHVGYRGDAEDQPKRIRALLRAGAEIEAADGNGRTALHWAAWQGHTHGLTVTANIARVLIDAGANVHAVDSLGRTPLHYAAAMGHDPIVKALLAAGADAAATDREGKTPADLAQARELASTLETLSASAATEPVTSTPAPGEEAAGRFGRELMQATRGGDVAKVRELLRRGADVNWMDSDGFRPIDRARDAGHEEIVRLLQEAEQRRKR